MRIGLMVGPERGRYATKVERMISDAVWAEQAGMSSVWIPQVPDEFDAMTAAVLVARETTRIEIGTAVVPLQSRHPIALIQQALSTQLVAEGRFALGIGPSHHWIISDMLGLPYDKPAGVVNDYLDVLDGALAGPGDIKVSNSSFNINNPMYVTDQPAMPVLLAALGPVMLKIAGSRADGTILWLADEKAIETHVAPKISAAAAECRPWCSAHHCRGAGVLVLAERSRHRGRPGQPSSQRGRGVAELPTPARHGQRHHRGRHLGRRRRNDDPGSPRFVQERWRHRPVGSGGAHRRRPRRAARVEPPHPRVPRLAGNRPHHLTTTCCGRRHRGTREIAVVLTRQA